MDFGRSALALVLLLLLASGAAADSKSVVGNSAMLEQTKEEVLSALSVGNPGYAEEILDRTFRADPNPTLLYHLGLVAQSQARPVAALDLYRRYQASVGAAVPAEINAIIENFAAGMTAPVTTLDVIGDAGMLLCMDDKIVGMLPLRTPVVLAGGTHRFRIERRDDQYETGRLSIPDGREAELRLVRGANGKAVALLSLYPIVLLQLESKRLPESLAQAVSSALVDAARREHLAPTPRLRLDLQLKGRPPDCLSQPDCQFAVAEALQARSIIHASVQPADRPSPTSDSPADGCSLNLTYLDVNAGQVASTGSAQSSTCAGPPLTAALATAIKALLTTANQRPRGMVSVSSVPEGAQVRVDGLLRGKTPYLKASFIGPHTITVEKDEFRPYATKVDVMAGKITTMQAPLVSAPLEVPEPPPAPLLIEPAPRLRRVERREPRPRWRLVLGGLTLGGGLILLGVGAAALSLDGQCAQPQAEGELCAGIYATGIPGGALVGAGVALGIAGGVLLALPGQRKSILVPIE